MAGFTDRGKLEILDWVFLANTKPVNFYVMLIQANTVPTNAINTVSQITQIVSGYGYLPGGYPLSLEAACFDVIKQDPTNARGYIQLKDIVWTASGGAIPVNQSGARYAVLTNDNATQANREIYAYWDLTSARTVSDGQTLTLQDCELRLNES